MEYSDIYFNIRSELINDSRKITLVQSWAMALAGGVALLAITKLSSAPLENAPISDPYDITAFVIAGGALLTYALWSLTNRISEGITRIGMYLLEIERREGLNRGWEHFVWLQTAKGLRPRGHRIASDVMFWAMLTYTIAIIILLLEHQSAITCIGVGLSLACLIAGSTVRLNEYKQRMRIYNSISPLFRENYDWDKEICMSYKKRN